MTVPSQTRRRARLVASALGLCAVAVVGADITELPPCPEVLGSPDPVFRCVMTGGSSNEIRFGATEAHDLLLRIAQRGHDVSVRIESPLGVTELDALTLAAGDELVVAGAPTAQDYRVDVTWRPPVTDAARVVVELVDLTAVPAAFRDAAHAHAAANAAAGTPSQRRERSLGARFESLAARWLEIDETSLWAQALVAAGRLAREHGETARSAEMLDRVLARLAGTHATVLEAIAVNERGLTDWKLSAYTQARARFVAAGEALAQAGLPGPAATSQNNICLMDLELYRLATAADCFDTLATYWQRLGVADMETFARNNLGGVFYLRGEADRARAQFRRALELARDAGHARREVGSLGNLALVARAEGDLQEALRLYDSALAIARTIADRDAEARLTNNIGVAWYRAGEPLRARVMLEEALPLRIASGDRRGEAVTLGHLGDILADLDALDAALEHHRRALAIYTELDAPENRAGAELRIGRVHRMAGRYDAALEKYRAAERTLGDSGSVWRRADVLQGQGETLLELDKPRDALDPLGRAEALRLQTGDRLGIVTTQVALARAQAALGIAADAERRVDAVLVDIESLAGRLTRPGLRSAFYAAQRQAYELAVALRLDRHRDAPDAGWEKRAFAVADRSRARGFLAYLDEAGIDWEADAPPALRARRIGLERRLRAVAAARDRALRRGVDEDTLGEFDTAVERLLVALDTVDDELRRASTEYAALTAPGQSDVARVQAMLGAGQTLVLFQFGEMRSARFDVTRTRVEVAELPPAKRLDADVLAALSSLRTVTAGAGDERAALARLSRSLFAGMPPPRDGSRWLVIPDGALHYLPIAALPDPWTDAAGGAQLVDRVSIARLPAASLLNTARPGARPDREPSITIVAADPAQLTGAAAESDWLGSRIAPARRRVLSGPVATRSALLELDLAETTILHFAVHGTFDARFPALSALHLPGGEAATGENMLRAADLYRWSLSADLVVLGACDTALGRQVAGEGLVGLTHGFRRAGAARVVASLWQVPDKATSLLMRAFYAALLDDGRDAAAALREAQLAVRKTPGYRDPYYWAGFVTFGG